MSSETTDGAPTDHLRTSTRDPEDLRRRLEAWLATRPEVGAKVRIESLQSPEANGMSSETLLFDASWLPASPGGERVERRFVARMAPAGDAVPVFPHYDLGAQVRVMRLVGSRTSAPVPAVHWYEPDASVLGSEFFVMDRVDGQVPPDVMPYTFDGSWVIAATPEQRAHLQATSVDVLAAIHGIEVSTASLAALDLHDEPEEADGRDEPDGPDQTEPTTDALLARHFARERRYYDWVRGDLRLPVVERALDWLEGRWPSHAVAAPPVVCWGDSRIGNILYQDFEPRAVLDWEMATVGPRELDLGWFIFLHRFFQDIAADFGMAGLPDFLDQDTVARQYAERTGHEPRDLDWFVTYAATRHGSIMARTHLRRIQFGEATMPDDPEEMVLHRRAIEALISG